MRTGITEEQQEEFEFLVLSNKIEAIRYAQQHFGLDAEQAITMVERTEQKLEGDADTELKKTSVQLPSIVGGVFGTIGIVLLALAAWFGYRSYNFIEHATHVPGMVKEYVSGRSHDVEKKTMYTLYAPVYQYHYNGKDYTFQSPYGSTEREYAVGDQVDLLIDPRQPDKPEEYSFMGNWFLPMILGSIGLIFAGVGTIVLRAFRKP